MMKRGNKRGFFGSSLVALSVAAAIGLAVYIVSSSSGRATADNYTNSSTPQKAASKTDKAPRETGPSGLPVPRFVSLKRKTVNVRRGPSSEHKIAWKFHFKGLPVEVVAEFEHWRRIRDSDGQEGWVYHSLLAGKRTMTVAPWRKGFAVALRGEPQNDGKILANVNAGAVGEIESCNGKWCEVDLKGYRGWISQAMLWGVYPNEKIIP